MSQPRKHLSLDPGLLASALVATIAAWPLITRPSLPSYTDVEHHLYRTYEILSAWQQGVPYLRWAPDLFMGYGYPVFNFYAPLTHYLGAAYGGLCCGLATGPVAGVKFVLVLSAYLGAAGMYLLARDHYGALAGAVGAAVYGLAPYVGHTNPIARGVSPETFAVALGPWLLRAFMRVRHTASPRDMSWAALTLAALTLSHNLISFLFLGLVLVWLGWDIVFARPDPSGPTRLRAMGMVGAALVLGLGLSAFMWLPALLERDEIQFQRVLAIGEHHVRAGELFGPPEFSELADPDIRQSGRFRLGLAAWISAGLGALTLLHPRLRNRTTAFFALALAGMIFFILPLSIPIWDRLPQLNYLQFPWRLLGPAAVAEGMLAAAALCWADLHPQPWSATALGAVIVAACVVNALPLMDPLPWADYGSVSYKRLFVMEQNGIMGIGTTIQFEFLPVTVTDRPGPNQALISSYETGQVDKVDRTTVPAETQVAVLEHGPVHDRFQITGPTAFNLQILTFAFPGWTAYLDGAKTPITIAEPEGFIRAPIPAGEHELLLRFEDTPPRQLGWGISGVALLVIVIGGLWPSRRLSQKQDRLAWRPALALSLVVAIGMGVRDLADRVSPWQVDLLSYSVPGVEHQQLERLENNVALLAYDLPQITAHPGEQVPLTLYWKATARVPLDLSVFVHMIGPDGLLWGQSDKLMPVDFFPTGRWPLNRYLRDEHTLTLQPDAPPGQYTLKAGLWDRYTGLRMHVLDANSHVTDQDGIVLTTQVIVQP